MGMEKEKSKCKDPGDLFARIIVFLKQSYENSYGYRVVQVSQVADYERDYL